MHYVDILAKFLEMFPQHQEKIKTWAHHGPKSIKVTCRDHSVLIFTYFSDKNWSLTSQG